MFLYVRIVLADLDAMSSLEEIKNKLNVLPSDLHEA